jgi:hypothetical protein
LPAAAGVAVADDEDDAEDMSADSSSEGRSGEDVGAGVDVAGRYRSDRGDETRGVGIGVGSPEVFSAVAFSTGGVGAGHGEA